MRFAKFGGIDWVSEYVDAFMLISKRFFAILTNSVQVASCCRAIDIVVDQDDTLFGEDVRQDG